MRDEIAGAEEIPSGRYEVSSFVPKIGESQDTRVQNKDDGKDKREVRELLDPRFARSHGLSRFSRSRHHDLVNGTLRHVGIEFDLAECLFVVCEILLQHEGKRLSLLRTEIDTL